MKYCSDKSSADMHFWGASLVIIMMFLHMLRVFFTGSYKAPREMNWVVGVLIFFVVMGFGFTGYLLPWDQKAYWATAVGAQIAESVPWIGKYIRTVLIGGDMLGALTLTRFFAIHVFFLPAGLLGLLGSALHHDPETRYRRSVVRSSMLLCSEAQHC